MSGSAVPVSVVTGLVAAAREYARVGDGVDAALLATLAEAAVVTAEAFCGEAIVRRTFRATLAPAIGWRRLPVVPVRSIDAVTDGDGVALAVEAYAIDIDADGAGWVRAGGMVKVSYTAGCAASWGAVPMPLAQGLAMLVAHLFGRAEAASLPPAAVAALWRPFRRLHLAAQVRA